MNANGRHVPTTNDVVFETYGQGPPDGTAAAVATVPATWRSLAQCTRQIRYLTSSTALPDQNFNPSWSPNGQRIIYCHFSYVDPGPAVDDIWTMRFNGTGKTPVSTDPRFEFRPDWGRSARWN
jgi:Tol biopolymer transport system component